MHRTTPQRESARLAREKIKKLRVYDDEDSQNKKPRLPSSSLSFDFEADVLEQASKAPHARSKKAGNKKKKEKSSDDLSSDEDEWESEEVLF